MQEKFLTKTYYKESGYGTPINTITVNDGRVLSIMLPGSQLPTKYGALTDIFISRSEDGHWNIDIRSGNNDIKVFQDGMPVATIRANNPL